MELTVRLKLKMISDIRDSVPFIHEHRDCGAYTAA